MGPFAKALDNIKFTIPIQVLNEAFKDNNDWRRAPISLDERIMQLIRSRVMVDCNLVGGQTAIIPLDGLSPDYADNNALVYHIPKERTQNRSIFSVLSVNYTQRAIGANSLGTGFGNIASTSMSDVTNAAQRVGDAMSGIPPISSGNVTLIGENTILIRDQFRVTAIYSLRCLLANDEQLGNISPRSYLHFADLCILAVKSYIYNTLLIKMDQAFLQGGQELGAMKSYVESLSDAEEMYKTYLNEVWRPTAFMNDTHSHTRLIKLQINSAL